MISLQRCPGSKYFKPNTASLTVKRGFEKRTQVLLKVTDILHNDHVTNVGVRKAQSAIEEHDNLWPGNENGETNT